MNDAAKPAAAGSLVGLAHLRALAIVLVFLYHYRLFAHPGWVDRVGAFGWTGVDLFFVLSGFLISRQLFRELATRGTLSLREFYFKRLLRIVPAYLVVLAAYFCFPSIHERESLPPLWRFLTFTQNIGLDLRSSGTFSHGWSTRNRCGPPWSHFPQSRSSTGCSCRRRSARPRSSRARRRA